MTSAQRARTCEHILEKYSGDGSFDAIEVELTKALPALDPNQRVTFLTSLAETALARGDAARAIPFCRSLLEGPELPTETLEVVERLSEAGEDAELLRRVLELTVKRAAKPSIRARALERLGDFFDAWQHDTRRATRSWRAAALQFSNEPAEINDSRRLYERVLSTAPSDSLSASRLVELSVAAGDWLGAAGAFDALLRSSPPAQDVCELLLLLEAQAETPEGGEQRTTPAPLGAALLEAGPAEQAERRACARQQHAGATECRARANGYCRRRTDRAHRATAQRDAARTELARAEPGKISEQVGRPREAIAGSAQRLTVGDACCTFGQATEADLCNPANIARQRRLAGDRAADA